MTELLPWAPSDTPGLNRAVAERAFRDIGILEIPLTSNRSTRIDQYVAATGAPLGSYWCAAAVAAWFRDVGAKTPASGAASCDTWMKWAKIQGAWRDAPAIGRAVVYGRVKDDADHIGVVVRVAPLLCSVEGNTSVSGSGFDRNGIGTAFKAVFLPRVLGYIEPAAL